MKKTILVTGGAGFIGSRYIRYLLHTYEHIDVINADALKYAAQLENVAAFVEDPRYQFLKCDLTDESAMRNLFKFPIDEVVHFAAESHVDRSIDHVDPFVQSNVVGTTRLIEAVRRMGVKRMVHVSTDEVYGSVSHGYLDESAPLAPRNPYAASKASSDLLCMAAVHTHGLPIVISRCTNNYGPHQHQEKLIPKLIGRALQHRSLPLYGNGEQIRDWIHVDDHCTAIDAIRCRGRTGEIYHVSAEETKTNIEMAKSILEILEKPSSLIQFVGDRPGHDERYALSAQKLRSELFWQPRISLMQGLKETVKWYRRQEERREGWR
ncbi:dTDP-glucose 4,6-dehydratase [Mechercharimyces sp. CAU 1602]|uniref:dTDP-glucose 4,6-dehydratase n=1 Tax=Mechercharimyces sp. CAU 1602 TaxID=2973933 RepID=UPI0021626AF8|nr:dTDP-glucose 4,6-dehydratase [Mechercharimyces sp. CAU 1602]MCS1351123.1 dTDP-glucose 4,6-dehydratase [Mechercharimyces sp. CAU 1602]